MSGGWVVPGLVCSGDLVVVTGQPRSGKTQMAAMLTHACMSSGGKVTYCAGRGETPESFSRYLSMANVALGADAGELITQDIEPPYVDTLGPMAHGRDLVIIDVFQPELVIDANDGNAVFALVCEMRSRCMKAALVLCIQASKNRAGSENHLRGSSMWTALASLILCTRFTENGLRVTPESRYGGDLSSLLALKPFVAGVA